MSEETTETTETNEPAQETGKGLRAQLEKALAENKGLRAGKLADSFKEIGLDVNAGYGKAIAQNYDGEITVEAVATYAKDEFGYVKPEATHPAAPVIAQAQAQADQFGQVATPVQPATSLSEQLAAAEAAGDHELIGAIQGQQMQDMMDRQNQLK